MSYYGNKSGFAESSGMGAAFSVSTTPNEGLRSIQRSLQRMGLLAAGTGASGADGEFGPITADALTRAASQLGRSGAAYTMSNAGRLVTISDDFITALQSAATPSAVLSTLPPSPGDSPVPSQTVSLPEVEEESEGLSRTSMYLIGGSVAAIGTVAAVYFFWPQQKRSTPNRRRAKRIRRR